VYVLILIPFLIQGLAIAFDEYYFHIKRGLPLWERIGHPLDTLSVLICFGFVLFAPYSAAALKVYAGLCAFSCLMVTKDEWVHKHHCPASENWLHALLFINHPILLTCVGLIWWTTANTSPLWLQQSLPQFLQTTLVVQFACIAVFFLYQVIYWNFIWKKEIKSL